MAGTRGPRSWRVALTGAAWAWVLLLLVSPLWGGQSGAGPRSVAAVVRLIGAQVCHQRPERSFHLHGRPLPVCGRCTGLYVSGALGLLAASLGRRRLRPTVARGGPGGLIAPAGGGAAPIGVTRRAEWLWAAAAPTLVTWTIEVAGLWDPGTPLRAVAAVPLGATTGWLLHRALQD